MKAESCLFSVTSLHSPSKTGLCSLISVMRAGSLPPAVGSLPSRSTSQVSSPEQRSARARNSSRISWRSLVWKSRYRGREGWTPVWPVPRARQSAAEFQKPCSCVGRFSRLHGIRKKQKDGKCLHPPEKNCLFPMPLFCGVADWGEETSEAKMPCRVYLYQR